MWMMICHCKTVRTVVVFACDETMWWNMHNCYETCIIVMTVFYDVALLESRSYSPYSLVTPQSRHIILAATQSWSTKFWLNWWSNLAPFWIRTIGISLERANTSPWHRKQLTWRNISFANQILPENETREEKGLNFKERGRLIPSNLWARDGLSPCTQGSLFFVISIYPYWKNTPLLVDFIKKT